MNLDPAHRDGGPAPRIGVDDVGSPIEVPPPPSAWPTGMVEHRLRNPARSHPEDRLGPIGGVLVFPVAVLSGFLAERAFFAVLAPVAFVAGTILVVASIICERRAGKQGRAIDLAKLPSRYRGLVLSAVCEVANIRAEISRLPVGPVAERLAEPTARLQVSAWQMAEAAASAGPLLQTAKLAGEAGEAELSAQTTAKIATLDTRLTDQLGRLRELHAEATRVRASVALMDPALRNVASDPGLGVSASDDPAQSLEDAVAGLADALAEVNAVSRGLAVS